MVIVIKERIEKNVYDEILVHVSILRSRRMAKLRPFGEEVKYSRF